MGRQWILLCVSLFALVGCSHPRLSHQSLGARELIEDSYRLDKGKGAILQFEGVEMQPIHSELFIEEPDFLVSGDVIDVAFFHSTRQEELSQLIVLSKSGFIVSGGYLTLPLIGTIEVSKKTLDLAQKEVEERYQEEISGIQVFLSYRARPTKRVFLTGSIAESSLLVDGKTHLYEVLSLARLATEANLFKSYLLRGKHLISVDFAKLLKQGDMSQNIVVKPGDKIYIAPKESAFLYVLGEVKKEGPIPILDGTISVKEAIAKAGGIPFTGDLGYIQVIRGSLVSPRIYTISWKHIVELPNHSLLLIPGDILYVSATPITQWNRFVNQLFPSFTIYELFNKGIQGIIVQ